MNYGSRGLVQELELHGVVGGTDPGRIWRSRESEAKSGRPPRGMVSGNVMEGFGELSLYIAATSVDLLPDFLW